jgi:hypothetical protein
MNSSVNDYQRVLSAGHQPPCLSLFQPTHRHHPDNKQDVIRFRNLLKSMERSLIQRHSARDTQSLLAPFRALADNEDFWNHALGGLAVFGAADFFKVYKLQRPTPELAVVADSFHTKPLIRVLQSADRYQVLGLSRHEVKLFEGDRDALDEVELAAGVPRTITEALGDQLTEPHLTVASYGGVGGAAGAMRHGHGGRKDEVDVDAERFFRAVDRAILERHSRPSGLPLMLAALPEHHALFRKVSHNPFLTPGALDFHPDTLPGDALRERAWKVVEPDYSARLRVAAESFAEARSKERGTDDLAQAARATAAGRVATLLVEADRQIPGRLDQATGAIGLGDMSHPQVDDLLDDMAALTLERGGMVLVVPGDRMPTKTGVAAIYRY